MENDGKVPRGIATRAQGRPLGRRRRHPRRHLSVILRDDFSIVVGDDFSVSPCCELSSDASSVNKL